jgi:hypothetical protein
MRPNVLRALVLAICTCALVAAPASAAPSWAPASSAAIHPGVQTFTDGAQCTANFVFYDASKIYLGQAAHCSGTGTATDTDGCTSASLPLGTAVDIGGSQPGTLVYNSWLTMQAHGESDANTCAHNDLALVKVDPADLGEVNPSVPFWGGPKGLDTNGTATGDTVLSFGNSELRGGVTQLSPKQGKSLGDAGNGWSHTVYTATPGIPGDSGSAFLNAAGQAVGVLSTRCCRSEPRLRGGRATAPTVGATEAGRPGTPAPPRSAPCGGVWLANAAAAHGASPRLRREGPR